MTTTAFVCTAGLIILAIYDLWIINVSSKGVEASVSRWMQNMGFKYPLLTFAIGFLMGHWFGYMPPTLEHAYTLIFGK